MLQNKRMWTGLVVVLLLVGVVVFLNKKTSNKNDYSVVYLTTGEVYIGHLSTFPDFELKDSYILQLAKDANDPSKSNFQLQPINEALWAPQSLHINKKNVVFYGLVLKTSQIAQTLAEKANMLPAVRVP